MLSEFDISSENGRLWIKLPTHSKLLYYRLQLLPNTHYDQVKGAWCCPDNPVSKQWLKDFFPFCNHEFLKGIAPNRLVIKFPFDLDLVQRIKQVKGKS